MDALLTQFLCDAHQGRRRENSPHRRLVLLIALSIPFLFMQAVGFGVQGWQPAGDTAIAATRSFDLVSTNAPSLGMVTSLQTVNGVSPSHPGPAWFIVMAPFVFLFGPSVGLPIAATALVMASFLLIAWCSQRERSVGFATIAYLFAGASVTVLHLAVALPDNARTGAPILLAILFLSWRAQSRDSAVIAPLLLLASALAQFHVQYVLVCLSLSIWALMPWRSNPRALVSELLKRSLRGGVTVLALAIWIPPLVNAVRDRGGNVRRLVLSIAGGESSVGTRGAINLADRILDPLPPFAWWEGHGSVGGMSVFGIVGGCLLVMCLVATRRSGDQSDLRLLKTALVGTAAAAATSLGLPVSGFEGWQVLFQGVVMVFFWFAMSVSLIDYLRSRTFRRLTRPNRTQTRLSRSRIAFAHLCAVALMAIAGVPFSISRLPDSDILELLPNAASRIASVAEGGGNYLMIRRGGRRSERIMNGLILQLERKNTNILVPPGVIPQWGRERAFPPRISRWDGTFVVMEPSRDTSKILGNPIARFSSSRRITTSELETQRELVRFVGGFNVFTLTDEGRTRLGEISDGRIADPCVSLDMLKASPELLLDGDPGMIRALFAENLVESPTLPANLRERVVAIHDRHPLAIYNVERKLNLTGDLTNGSPINDLACASKPGR